MEGPDRPGRGGLWGEGDEELAKIVEGLRLAGFTLGQIKAIKVDLKTANSLVEQLTGKQVEDDGGPAARYAQILLGGKEPEAPEPRERTADLDPTAVDRYQLGPVTVLVPRNLDPELKANLHRWLTEGRSLLS